MLASETADEQSPRSPIADSVGVPVRYPTAAALARLADEGTPVAVGVLRSGAPALRLM
jgi:hypothetical protein